MADGQAAAQQDPAIEEELTPPIETNPEENTQETETEESTEQAPEADENLEEMPSENGSADDNSTEDEAEKPKEFHNRTLVFVMSGLHKGAGCAVEEETSIGSNFDNDLIITDDEVASQHLVLRPIQKGLDYAVEVICKGENVVIDGQTIIEAEQSIIMEDTFVAALGSINLNITLHKAHKATIAYKKYMAPKLRELEALSQSTKQVLSPEAILSDVRNIILSLILIITVLGLLIFYVTRPAEKKELHKTNSDYSHIKTLHLKEKNIILNLHNQAIRDLKYVMKKYDLLSRLSISDKNSIIFVKGRINHYEMNNWRKVLNWFDTTYGVKIDLVDLVKENKGLRRTISFKAVVADGAMPYVVSWTGDRFRPGSTLPGGWIILKIGEEGITVKDAIDNRTFIVKHIRSQHGQRLPNFRE